MIKLMICTIIYLFDSICYSASGRRRRLNFELQTNHIYAPSRKLGPRYKRKPSKLVCVCERERERERVCVWMVEYEGEREREMLRLRKDRERIERGGGGKESTVTGTHVCDRTRG